MSPGSEPAGRLVAAMPTTRRRFLAGALATAALLPEGCGSSVHRRTQPTPRAKPPPPATPRPLPRNLRDAVRGRVLERGQPGFAEASRVFNERYDGVLPRAIAFPLDASDVGAALRWARARDVPVRLRSGGHSYAGYSTLSDGVVVDLAELNQIAVDRGAETVIVGAATRLMDLYFRLAREGALVPSGSCPSVGVAGIALGGGMGLAGRAYGLMSDSLLAAEIVTADGSVRQVNGSSDRDLLWALRGGGGGNFGAVTGLTFAVQRLPRASSYFFVSFPWDAGAAEAIAAWQAWAPNAPDALTSILHLDAGGGSPALSVSGQYLGPASELASLLNPLTGIAGASASYADADYLRLQLRWAGCLDLGLEACHLPDTRPGGQLSRDSFRASSDYVSRPLSSAAIAALLDAIARRSSHPGSGAVLFDAYGGVINRVPPDASAFVHRDALFCIQYLTYNDDSDWLDSTYAALRPYVSGEAYQNYIDPNLTGWRRAYYGRNYPRLVAVRERVDPEHFFRFPQAIGL